MLSLGTFRCNYCGRNLTDIEYYFLGKEYSDCNYNHIRSKYA